MTHPLTDEMIEQIAQFEPDLTDRLRYNRDYDMRAAADWQLEQVIEFILKEETVYYDTPTLLADYIKEAMRPQENNND